MDYEKNSAAEFSKWCEAVALKLPFVAIDAFGMLADFSLRQTQLWWRAISDSTAFSGTIWPQWASAAEADYLAAEIKTIQTEMHLDFKKRQESEGAVAARLDHLHDEVGALRQDLNTALMNREYAVHIERLNTELATLRGQMRDALTKKQDTSTVSATALAELQTELQTLRERMVSPPVPAQVSGPAKTERPTDEERSRKRPRR